MSDLPLTGEVSNSKLAAAFESEATARAAVIVLVDQTSLETTQLKVVKPGERHPGIALEPEGGGIFRTLLVAHLWLGLAGLAVGGIAFAVMLSLGVQLVVASPWPSAFVLVFFGGMLGLMLGGLVALRPDHDPYVLATRDAMTKGQTTLVVHALSSEQADQAAALLAEMGGEVTRTL
ncbi:hypothetical protein [Arenimonas donghaensis]|uniref:Riboflavin biosynthesis protein RibA n=1 Tax=Arenimonas donghaensis DSM 18148 = HO3-R19 TaxID=1121014 RepID=A0A087MHB6_9GAMM|nr:hypothetical protein [Arenimonas donghaensis]KFL36269.1 hypothetical protein N788_05100 [Arenimonas donghaensis DSM 18148 = HO3-R19]